MVRMDLLLAQEEPLLCQRPSHNELVETFHITPPSYGITSPIPLR